MANITVDAAMGMTDDKEGVQKIPHNKTLIAIQLTDNPAAEPQIVSEIDSLANVFSFYAPKKSIFFTTLTGGQQKDTLYFKSLNDFDPLRLETLSKAQQTLALQKTSYANIVRLIHTDAALQTALLVQSDREDILEDLKNLKSQLEKNKKSIAPIVSKNKPFLLSLCIEVSLLLDDPVASSKKAVPRAQLLTRLAVWEDFLFQNYDNHNAFITYALAQSQKAADYYRNNIQHSLDENKLLERSYRTLDLFFTNTEAVQLNNVHFMDAAMSQLSDLEDSRYYDAIATALTNGFDRLDLVENYGLLLIPGFVENPNALEKFTKAAFQNKAFLCTDFRHLENPDDVVALFEESASTGTALHKSNILMTCNWLVGRGLYRQYGEPEHLFIPPSAVLAGKIYKNEMSQASAGTTFGVLDAVQGTCFYLNKGEVSYLEKIGLIPMVGSSGMVYAQSSKTLFTGDNLGLQTYSVVRVFDYVTKALMDFLNRKTFESFNAKSRKNLIDKIVRFMDEISGAGKLIENFNITRFEQDKKERDKVHLQIHMTPYFPAKNFVLSMDGQQGEHGNTNWEAHYAQLN